MQVKERMHSWDLLEADNCAVHVCTWVKRAPFQYRTAGRSSAEVERNDEILPDIGNLAILRMATRHHRTF